MVALVLSAAACFHDSGDQRLTEDGFEARAQEILQDARAADRLYYKLVVGEGLGDRKACGAAATEFHHELEKLLGEIEDVNPPADIDALYQDLVAAARQSVARVGEVAAEARRGEVACGPPMNHELYDLPSRERAERALEQIEARGYFIFGE